MKTVAGAILHREGKIFICQRPSTKSLAHLWEFPGGKQEEGETLSECLRRELREELNIDCAIGRFFMTSAFEYDFGTIELHTFLVPAPPGPIRSNEHENTLWVTPDRLKDFSFAPADIPVVEKLSLLKL